MGIELLNIDCMEYMKTCSDNEFDLAICDPPYTNDINGLKMGVERTQFHLHTFNAPDEKYFAELRRVSKNQIIWGGNYFTDKLPMSRCWIAWDKIEGGFNFSKIELAWTSFNKVSDIFRYCNHGGFVARGQNIKIHPTQKPVELYDFCLTKFAEKGQKILDTHLGSGSIAIASHYYGVNLVGCEIDTEYYNKAVKNYETNTIQTKLF